MVFDMPSKQLTAVACILSIFDLFKSMYRVEIPILVLCCVLNLEGFYASKQRIVCFNSI